MMLITNSKIREKMVRVTAAVQAAGIDPTEAKVRTVDSVPPTHQLMRTQEAIEIIKTKLRSE